MHLRSISSCSLLSLQAQLDNFLESMQDLPFLPGFNTSLDGDIVDGGHYSVMAGYQIDVAEQA